jgi:hypothetical protein
MLIFVFHIWYLIWVLSCTQTPLVYIVYQCLYSKVVLDSLFRYILLWFVCCGYCVNYWVHWISPVRFWYLLLLVTCAQTKHSKSPKESDISFQCFQCLYSKVVLDSLFRYILLRFVCCGYCVNYWVHWISPVRFWYPKESDISFQLYTVVPECFRFSILPVDLWYKYSSRIPLTASRSVRQFAY